MPESVILGARIKYFLNLADNTLSSTQCRQFVAQAHNPSAQGSFIDEAQRGLGNKSGLGCANAQATARALDGLGVELAFENTPGHDDLWDFVSQRVHHRVLPAVMQHDAGAREELGKLEARRAVHLAASCCVDCFGHTCDVDVAAKRARELTAHPHGNSRRNTARAEVDDRAIPISAASIHLRHIAKKTAVDGPLSRPWFQGLRAWDEAACHPLEDTQRRGRGGHAHLTQQAPDSR